MVVKKLKGSKEQERLLILLEILAFVPVAGIRIQTLDTRDTRL